MLYTPTITSRTTLLLCMLAAACAQFACGSDEQTIARTPSSSLRALTQQPAEGWVRQTVYVPVYSSLDIGEPIRQNVVQLAATVSIRNVSPTHPGVVLFARYFDSAGTLIREYVPQPGELGPLATTEFVIPRHDTTGGPGANFLIGWTAPAGADAPLMEAVMLGRSGNAGIAFASPGRVLTATP
jgi:hypothetical protein